MPDTWEDTKYLARYERDAMVFEILLEGEKSFSELMRAAKIKHGASLTRSLKRLSSHGFTYRSYQGKTLKPVYAASPIGKVVFGFYKELEKAANESNIEISSERMKRLIENA